MADAGQDAPELQKKGFPIVVTLLVCALMAGGGFMFVKLDPLHLIPAQEVDMAEQVPPPAPLGVAAFIPLDPVLISLGPNARADHLRFAATLDVAPQYEAEVRAVLPRIADMFATYLRAVEPTMLEQPAALLTLRAQMLRRVSVIVGRERVNDLLITEFILN